MAIVQDLLFMNFNIQNLLIVSHGISFTQVKLFSCIAYLCDSKVERISEKIISKSFGFCWTKGFYKVVNFSSRHFSPLSVLKLLANKRLLKRFYCPSLFEVIPASHGREMRESMRWGNIPYRVLPRHSPGLIKPKRRGEHLFHCCIIMTLW